MDKIDDYELTEFIKMIIPKFYWEDTDDYYAYDLTVTQVYNMLIITVAYVL